MADLAGLSTEDLLALKARDMSKVSTRGLMALRGDGGNIIPSQSQASFQPRTETPTETVSNAPYDIGGGVTDALATHVPASVAAGAGYLANVGAQALPTLAGVSVGSLARPMGQRLMRSALKPSVKDVLTGKGDRAIQTLLAGETGNILPGANVSTGGVATMQRTANRLGTEADALLAPSTATVSRAGVYPPVGETLRRAENQVNPNADTAAVRSAWSEFLRHPSLQNIGAIPVQVANDLKSGTYRALGNKAYGELKGSSEEAQKAIARGLRQEIERAVPAVAPVNAHQSELINAIKVASRRNAVSGNKDPMALSLLANNPLAGAAFMANRSELIKSALARLLYHGGGPAATAAGGAASVYGQGEEQ